ncbi:unnamed protein product [Chondrus crispus]|uniref:Secreted protein n=1 Tax=Chondrus crispus TaxID=2769 RepID=R7QJM9_CHOCR|nr:unnamed protein product [Chondrus crispus]CDF37943.1 unnamed protein product [Chondrus crispus]|eukprot:XP_005717812.1 unnamed protein product [Chondrus crispus]
MLLLCALALSVLALTHCKQPSSCAAYIRHLLTPFFSTLLPRFLPPEIVRQIVHPQPTTTLHILQLY